MSAYRLTNAFAASNAQPVIRESDGALIPFDPSLFDWEVYINWLSQGNTPDAPITPPAAVPQIVTKGQACIALFLTPSPTNPGNTMLDDVNAAVASAGGATAIWWQYATTIDRNSASVTAIGTAFGLSSAQLDALFTLANQQSG
jgi:hypothetical protein